MTRFLLPLAIFFSLAAFFVFGLQNDPTYVPSPLLAQPLPAFDLEDLKEPPLPASSNALRGKPSLLNVWGSWCANCGVEHPFLMQLAREGTIDIYGLNWNDERAAAQQWLRERGDPYVFSAHDIDGRVAIDLGVYGAPETFLVNAEGVVVHKHIGPLSSEIWQRDFAPRLAQLAAP